MGSIGDSFGPLAPVDEYGFEALGTELVEAMSTYAKCLKDENLPPPSLYPMLSASTSISCPEGIEAKRKIVELSRLICATTMDPEQNLLISSLQFHFCSSLKVAIDLRIYEYIPLDGAVSLSQLAELAGADEAILSRIMRVLTKKHVFMQIQPGHYAHSRMSSLLLKEKAKDLLSHRLDEVFRSASREADALAQAGYREPKRGAANGFNLAFNTDKNFWEYITTDDPKRGARFARAMHAVNINSLDAISRLYPFDSLAADGGLIVDVGGGQGQVAKQILECYPNIGLRFIVQDGYVTNSSTSGSAAVEMHRHDFFEAQPIEGAAAYFFRHIFHDWSDNACVTILKQTARAMDKHRSRILICDQVWQDDSPAEASLLYDIDMMSLFGGKERSLAEWESLIYSAGENLEIVNVLSSPEFTAAILDIRFKL